MTMSTPAEWRVLPIGTIASPRLGGNYRNTATPTSKPLIKMGNIARITIDLNRVEYIPAADPVCPEHKLRHGDILFNTRNTPDLVGKVSIWRDELPVGYFNSNILRLEFKDKYCGSSSYFGYALNSAKSIEDIRALATGTTSVAAIYTRDLLKLEIPVPPKKEQIAIAAALTDVDSLITSLERLVTKKQAVKQGMMQQLLTGKIRLPGFAAPWNNVSAGDVGIFKGGSGFPLRHQGLTRGDYPFFKVSDMNKEGNGLFMRVANHYITESQRKLMGAVMIPKDSIVFAKVGAAIFLERKRILSEPSCIDNNMAAFLLNPSRADVRFVYYALMNFAMSSLVATSALPSLNGSQLRSIPLLLPSDLGEQCAIARVLADADDELELLEMQLSKTRGIKQGMMQELLTGRTRLQTAEATA